MGGRTDGGWGDTEALRLPRLMQGGGNGEGMGLYLVGGDVLGGAAALSFGAEQGGDGETEARSWWGA